MIYKDWIKLNDDYEYQIMTGTWSFTQSQAVCRQRKGFLPAALSTPSLQQDLSNSPHILNWNSNNEATFWILPLPSLSDSTIAPALRISKPGVYQVVNWEKVTPLKTLCIRSVEKITWMRLTDKAGKPLAFHVMKNEQFHYQEGVKYCGDKQANLIGEEIKQLTANQLRILEQELNGGTSWWSPVLQGMAVRALTINSGVIRAQSAGDIAKSYKYVICVKTAPQEPSWERLIDKFEHFLSDSIGTKAQAESICKAMGAGIASQVDRLATNDIAAQFKSRLTHFGFWVSSQEDICQAINLESGRSVFFVTQANCGAIFNVLCERPIGGRPPEEPRNGGGVSEMDLKGIKEKLAHLLKAVGVQFASINRKVDENRRDVMNNKNALRDLINKVN